MSMTMWSRPTWNIFHILTANLNESLFDEKYKNECINAFTAICNSIPCTRCREHASKYMKTINRNEIKTARDLELFFFKFHSKVNQDKRKKIFPKENLVVYKKESVRDITLKFRNILRTHYKNITLSNKFYSWMQKNEDKYIHFNKVEKDAKDAKDAKDKDNNDKKEIKT